LQLAHRAWKVVAKASQAYSPTQEQLLHHHNEPTTHKRCWVGGGETRPSESPQMKTPFSREHAGTSTKAATWELLIRRLPRKTISGLGTGRGCRNFRGSLVQRIREDITLRFQKSGSEPKRRVLPWFRPRGHWIRQRAPVTKLAESNFQLPTSNFLISKTKVMSSQSDVPINVFVFPDAELVQKPSKPSGVWYNEEVVPRHTFGPLVLEANNAVMCSCQMGASRGPGARTKGGFILQQT
jgi:hypothetical protein